MNDRKRLTDELINAAADGELDPREMNKFVADPDSARRIDELRQLSREINFAYHAPDESPISWIRSRNRFSVAVGLLILVTGGLMGFFAQDVFFGPADHLLLHVTQDSELSVTKAMGIIEQNLANGVVVELVAQRDGIAMIDVNSPVAVRLAGLAGEYDNFSVYACAGTLEKLRARDAAPTLIAAARTDVYAIDRLSYGYQNRLRYMRL